MMKQILIYHVSRWSMKTRDELIKPPKNWRPYQQLGSDKNHFIQNRKAPSYYPQHMFQSINQPSIIYIYISVSCLKTGTHMYT